MASIARGLLRFTPFGSNNSNVYELISTNELESAERLKRYREYQRFYKGLHWDWTRDSSEPFVTINYCQALVDTLVNFLFKKGFTVVIPDDPSTPTDEQGEREFIRLLLEATWERNKRDLLCFEMGQMGSVTGDVFLRVSWEDSDPLEIPYARVDVLPSQYVFPTFGGPHGVDRKRVENVLVLFPRYKSGEEPPATVTTRRSGANDVKIYAERWWPDRVEIWDPVSDAPPIVRPNPLGEIPIVHIPNYPVAGEYYGRSDLHDIIELQREYNEKATDISDVINYHGSPVTVVKGAKLSQLERGANRMWGLPEGAEVENLSLSGELNASMTYLKMIKTAMHEISGVPEGILGGMGIAPNSSGSATSMRYLPLIEKRNVKVQAYGYGIRLANRLILKLTAMMDDNFGSKFNPLPIENKFQNNIVFPDPLPRDESIELDRAKKRIELGLTTRKLELEKMGYSQLEITKILDEYEEEQQRFANFAPKQPQQNRSGNPDPVAPDPEVQGEAKSINAEINGIS